MPGLDGKLLTVSAPRKLCPPRTLPASACCPRCGPGKLTSKPASVPDDELRANPAVVTGTGMGEQPTLDAGFSRLHGRAPRVDLRTAAGVKGFLLSCSFKPARG